MRKQIFHMVFGKYWHVKQMIKLFEFYVNYHILFDMMFEYFREFVCFFKSASISNIYVILFYRIFCYYSKKYITIIIP